MGFPIRIASGDGSIWRLSSPRHFCSRSGLLWGTWGQAAQVLFSRLDLAPQVTGGPSVGSLDAPGHPVHGRLAPAPPARPPCRGPPARPPESAAHLTPATPWGWESGRVACSRGRSPRLAPGLPPPRLPGVKGQTGNRSRSGLRAASLVTLRRKVPAAGMDPSARPPATGTLPSLGNGPCSDGGS